MDNSRIVKIEWIDTFSESQWMDIDEIDERTKKENFRAVTVGHFIKETKVFYIVCMTKGEESHYKEYGLVKWIPKGTVTSIKELK